MNTELNNLPKFRPFDAFTQDRDSRTVEVGPYTIRATVHADYDSTPEDFGCYTPAAIAAWSRNEWQFVGIVLSVWVDEVCINDHAASLWSIECNFPDTDNGYLTEVADELLPEALAAARKTSAALLANLEVA